MGTENYPYWVSKGYPVIKARENRGLEIEHSAPRGTSILHEVWWQEKAAGDLCVVPDISPVRFPLQIVKCWLGIFFWHHFLLLDCAEEINTWETFPSLPAIHASSTSCLQDELWDRVGKDLSNTGAKSKQLSDNGCQVLIQITFENKSKETSSQSLTA